MARVMLHNTIGLLNEAGERVFFGPGEADVPDEYVEALGLEKVKSTAKAKKTDTKEDDQKES